MRKLVMLVLVLLTPVLGGCIAAVVGAGAAGAMVATDRRSTGAYTDDEIIEWKTSLAIREKYRGEGPRQRHQLQPDRAADR